MMASVITVTTALTAVVIFWCARWAYVLTGESPQSARQWEGYSIALQMINPLVQGWMNYFGKFNPSAMRGTLQCIERRIIKWAMCKYKNFRGRRRRAEKWLCTIRKREPKLFAHWSILYSYCWMIGAVWKENFTYGSVRRSLRWNSSYLLDWEVGCSTNG